MAKQISKMDKAELDAHYADLLERRDALRAELVEVKREVDLRLTMERTAALLNLKVEDLDREDLDALVKLAAKASPPPGSVTAEVNLLTATGEAQSTS